MAKRGRASTCRILMLIDLPPVDIATTFVIPLAWQWAYSMNRMTSDTVPPLIYKHRKSPGLGRAFFISHCLCLGVVVDRPLASQSWLHSRSYVPSSRATVFHSCVMGGSFRRSGTRRRRKLRTYSMKRFESSFNGNHGSVLLMPHLRAPSI
jgi:hypothetical protein